MERFVNRRLFLKLSGMSLALSLASPAWARTLSTGRNRLGKMRRLRMNKAQRGTPTLVVIFLRGGADGLNMMVPLESGEYGLYQDYRPDLMVSASEIDAAGTRLTDSMGADLQWGLNPRMAHLMDLWNSGSLAIFPDAHYENGSRSHFDSQQFYENGTPWEKLTPDGWANRFLSLSDPTSDPLLRAISFDNQTPFSLQGGYPTLTISSLGDLSVSGNAGRNERFLATQEVVYPMTQGGSKDYDPEVAQAGSDLIRAIRWIEQESPLPETDPAAPYPDGGFVNGRYSYFGNRLKDLAKLIKSDAFDIEIATVDLYGWDTHNLQLTAYHNHPNLVEALARGVSGFFQDLGAAYQENVMVAVFSEFGRTSRQNGSGGTDHGSATVSMVVGDPTKINGRRVLHGPSGWYGLGDLRDDRDLKYSIDFRDILGEIMQRHMGFFDQSIFPGHTLSPAGVVL